MNNFGERLKMLRAIHDYSQDDIAKKVGVTKATISAYETGTRFPSYEVIIKLCDFLGTSTDYLLGRERNNMVDVTGLSENEVEGIVLLISSLRKNRSK